MSASLHNVPELSLLTLFSFHCLLHPAEARQLRWCDVNIVDGSLSTRHEKSLWHIVLIKEPKTRRMAGHAAQQHVLLECPGICQLVRTMKSSIPDHRLDCSNLEIHCCSKPRLFRATTPQHWRVTSTLHAPRTTRRWSYRSVASISRFTATATQRVGGPLKGPLKDARSFPLHQNQLSREVADRLSALAELVVLFFAEQDYEESRHQPLQPPRCNGERVEEFTPFYAAASSNGALPTPSRLSERYLHHLVTWDENKEHADDAHDTSTDTLGWMMSSHA